MQRWKTCREFHSSTWPDGTVLYDIASGDTHQLTPSAFEILRLLQNTPLSEEELASRMLLSAVSTVDEENRAMIDATLAHLAQLGLIESFQN